MRPEDFKIQILTESYSLLNIPEGREGIELDIGCGKGGFTCGLAERFPGKTVFAVDIKLGRLRKLARRIVRDDIFNIVPVKVGADSVARYILPDFSIDRVHILCPDPWPKAKHRSKRLVTSEFLGFLGRILKRGGVFHFATDDIAYFESVANITDKSGIFRRAPESIADVADIATDFQKRWEKQNLVVLREAWMKTGRVN